MAEEVKKPVSVRMTEDEIWKFLEDGHTGILTTLRRDGYPIALPIWYAVVDRIVYIGTRGKKLSRIRHDPRSSFLVETGDRWRDLKAVHLTGKSEIVDVPDEVGERIRAEMNRKYAAFRTAPTAMPTATRDTYANANRGIVRFTPDARILNWDNTKLPIKD
jgi:nitroimidazol reductase NimA-like FMN-containing flavoprotein (pyridoxamine 5'-phosphate oxidase superfamily)